MACGEAVQVIDRYWSVCWAWIIPYPCRKARKKTKYCYDFSVVHQSCSVFYEKLHGCCGGQEYEWSAACFGWVSSYLSDVRQCFNAPLTPKGPCTEGGSLPPGGTAPGGPIDPGSVAPHPTSRTSGNSLQITQFLSGKLGVCRRCMAIGLMLAISSWLTLMFQVTGNWAIYRWMIIGASSLLLLAHLTAYLIRRGHSASRANGCGCLNKV